MTKEEAQQLYDDIRSAESFYSNGGGSEIVEQQTSIHVRVIDLLVEQFNVETPTDDEYRAQEMVKNKTITDRVCKCASCRKSASGKNSAE